MPSALHRYTELKSINLENRYYTQVIVPKYCGSTLKGIVIVVESKIQDIIKISNSHVKGTPHMSFNFEASEYSRSQTAQNPFELQNYRRCVE